MSHLDEIYKRMNDDLEMVNSVREEDSDVSKFYSGKTLFITGVTGFVGQCLLEKLLRSCSGIKKIYILIRAKRNETMEDRLKKYFQNEFFYNLRKLRPDFEKKVTAIKGDLALDNLGLSTEDRDVLKKETNMIFHNAANVIFTARVKDMLAINVIGTKNIIDLAEECENLEVFMYTSSAYSHIYRKVIREEFYQPAADLSTIYKMIEADKNTENGLSEKCVKSWIGDQFNVYTFSKAASEELIRQRLDKAKFPCGIYRPSIIINTFKEPESGWIGNTNGPILVFILAPLGILHTSYDKFKPFDMVPCDFTVNALLAIAWDLPSRWALKRKPVIYNYGSSIENPISLFRTYTSGANVILPSERSSKAVWMDFVILTNKFWLFIILHILLHFIPACIADAVLLLSGKKCIALRSFWKVTKNLDSIFYLANGNWKVYMHETLKVIDRLNSTDKQIFDCDIRELNWEDHIVHIFKGIRLHILKESLDGYESVRRYNLLWYAHYGLITTFILGFCYFILRFMIGMY